MTIARISDIFRAVRIGKEMLTKNSYEHMKWKTTTEYLELFIQTYNKATVIWGIPNHFLQFG